MKSGLDYWIQLGHGWPQIDRACTLVLYSLYSYSLRIFVCWLAWGLWWAVIPRAVSE